jgi:hypothetical protein
MAGDPDDFATCSAKLTYVRPDWFGDEGQMLEHGRECVRTENYFARIPYVLVDVHRSLAAGSGDEKRYYLENPGVWADLRSVYEPGLRALPTTHDRSMFAKLACACGRWEEASEQFAALGDAPDLKVFGGRASYDYFRRKAARKAAGPPAR